MDKPYGMDRPIQNKHMESLLNDLMKRISRSDYAGYVLLIDKDESCWSIKMDSSWSAIYREPNTDLGIRIRAKHDVPGDDEKLRLSAHTFVNMLRAGDHLTHLGLSLIKVIESLGIDVDYHRPDPPNIIGKDMKQTE